MNFDTSLTELVQLAMTGETRSERFDSLKRTIESLQTAVKKANNKHVGDDLSHDSLTNLTGAQLVGLCGELNILFHHCNMPPGPDDSNLAYPRVRGISDPAGFVVESLGDSGKSRYLNRVSAGEDPKYPWSDLPTVWADAGTAGRALDAIRAGAFDKFRAGRNKVVQEG